MPNRRPWIVVGSANNSSNLGDECMWEAAARVVAGQDPELRLMTDAQLAHEWRPPMRGVDAHPLLYTALQRGRYFSALRGRPGRYLRKLATWPAQIAYAERRLEAELKGRGVTDLGRHWADLIAASEGVIFSGAGAIADEYAIHGVYSWRLITGFAQAAGKPVAFVGQGVGPLTDARVRARAAEMLQLADLVAVREEKSRSLVESLGVNQVQLDGDWALLLVPTPEDYTKANAVLQSLEVRCPFIALSFHQSSATSAGDIRSFARLASAATREALRAERSVIFVSNMTRGTYSDDRVTAERVLAKMDGDVRGTPRIIRTQISSAVTKALLARAEALVTSRYHPLVFAMSAGVPAFGASVSPYYDQKLSGASGLFGVGGNVMRTDALSDSIEGLLRSAHQFSPAPPDQGAVNAMADRLRRFVTTAPSN